MSGRRTPRPLGDSIRTLRARVEPSTPLAAIQGSWRAAVGERIASEATPVREREGIVTVECRAATWAQELDLLQDELVGRLNDELGEARVRRLRLIVGQSLSSDSK
jgi:predicted nucleic acid-binding Zn ribbon protein